jgi:acetyl esterase|tara:strand:+ start:2702 stop:3550 length:849 start_codon:yes stop_codon:yes gene_type:complete
MNNLPKSPMIGETRTQELLSSATSYIYKQTPAGDLQAHFFFPPDFDYEVDRRPVIIFFHGGLWDITAATQFVPHCHHFASRGMVAATVEYRTKALQNGTPEDAITDAKDAILFFRTHATSLGIDPERIVMVGASAGGNAVLSAALLPHEPEDGPSPKPTAMILFGPISDTTRKGIGNEFFASPKDGKLLSPSTQLPQKDLPPCLIFHGKSDRVVPFALSERFAKRYRRKRNRCELMEFKNAGHTFFNYNSDEKNYEITVRSADHFLVELGILEPNPLADIMH